MPLILSRENSHLYRKKFDEQKHLLGFIELSKLGFTGLSKDFISFEFLIALHSNDIEVT